ncbi:flagellar biosynthesis anti-sigma factor FlgM [Helicobacter sp. 10-6591]|uniref:flagellar biosynthesis anti-sigma factor FlgM n=1 Tax=Helicobacter sp. 10-6591 TaxID=2004998 RepID=UPI000DD35111|nr:flagellar biosynthesis anti-sigma factor FlgM [Helicobacter sp. 10-6591]
MITGVNLANMASLQNSKELQRDNPNQNALKAHEAKESGLDKISVIKEQIANGTYNIDIQKTSQKMAQDLLNI